MQTIITFITSDFWNKLIPFITSLALFTSVFSLWAQRKHNKNSVRPLGYIHFCNYEDYISVSIMNKGTGPLIIDNIKFKKQNKTHSRLINFFPKNDFDFSWKTFSRNLNNRVLSVNDEVFLIEISSDSFKKNCAWENAKHNIRLQLEKIEIKITYKDIYDQKFPLIRTL